MKPLANRAREGRINPAGIPVLYLASSEQTAISEVRPWLGSVISVAQVSVLRELRAVDLSRGHGALSVGHLTLDELEGGKPVDARKKEKAVWIDVDNAFSQPVERSDDAADYVPTQILAELFRDAGFDAVIYRSQFGEKGYNIALFNVKDADVINCAPYRIVGIDLKYDEIGSRSYFKASGGHTGT
jgi:RES domain-containing protein